MYFLVKCEKKTRKTQGLLKNLEKTQDPQKKPKHPRFDRKTQDLGRKPKGWQRCVLHLFELERKHHNYCLSPTSVLVKEIRPSATLIGLLSNLKRCLIILYSLSIHKFINYYNL